MFYVALLCTFPEICENNLFLFNVHIKLLNIFLPGRYPLEKKSFEKGKHYVENKSTWVFFSKKTNSFSENFREFFVGSGSHKKTFNLNGFIYVYLHFYDNYYINRFQKKKYHDEKSFFLCFLHLGVATERYI